MAFDKSWAVTARAAHRVAIFSSILFFTAVAWLILAVVLNPDGGITGTASFFATLPWSILALKAKSTFVNVALRLFFGAVNAILLYYLVRDVRSVASFRTTIVMLAVLATLLTGVIWFFNSQEHDNRVRIVNGGKDGGAWIATDQDGLASKHHLVFIPNQTRGIYKGQRFLLKDGRLVDPYPATFNDMERDGAVEVEKIRITEGPHKGIEGWVDPRCLKRLLTMFAM